MGHRFVRRTQCYQILRVKCAERGRDGRPDPNNAFFHVWAEQCDPKIAANEEFGASHGGRASRMGRPIMLYFFDRRCGIIHNAARMGSLTISVHLRLQRASG